MVTQKQSDQIMCPAHTALREGVTQLPGPEVAPDLSQLVPCLLPPARGFVPCGVVFNDFPPSNAPGVS